MSGRLDELVSLAPKCPQQLHMESVFSLRQVRRQTGSLPETAFKETSIAGRRRFIVDQNETSEQSSRAGFQVPDGVIQSDGTDEFRGRSNRQPFGILPAVLFPARDKP
jgi:hypothetical protein